MMKHLSLLCILLFVGLTVFCQKHPFKASLHAFDKKGKNKLFRSHGENQVGKPKNHLPPLRIESMMMQLDSFIFNDGDDYQTKHFFSYPNQNTVIYEGKVNDISGGTGLHNYWQTNYTLDISGYMIENITEIWDDVNSLYENDSKETYSYTANHDVSQYIYYVWETGANQWKNDSKIDYTYNGMGDISLTIKYDWHSSINQWVPSPYDAKYEYFYNLNNTLDSVLVSRYDSVASQYIQYGKTDYIYDANGFLMTETTSNTSKHEYTNDVAGNHLTHISYSWDYNFHVWKESSKDVATFDVNNRKITEISYYFDDINMVWKPLEKYDYSYDANGNEISILGYPWNSTTSQWEINNEWKYIQTYDITHTYNDVNIPLLMSFVFGDFYTFDDVPTNNILLSYDDSFLDNGVWSLEEKMTAYYNLHNINSVSNPQSTDIYVYPNPTEEVLTLDMPFEKGNLEIRDVQGKLVFSQAINRKEEISLANVSKGIYMAHISNEKESYYFKLVVR